MHLLWSSTSCVSGLPHVGPLPVWRVPRVGLHLIHWRLPCPSACRLDPLSLLGLPPLPPPSSLFNPTDTSFRVRV